MPGMLLHVGQRRNRVIPGHELGRPLEGIRIASHVKGGRRPDLADQRRMEHVAEVDDPHDARMIVGCDKDVVQVIVVMDHL